MHYPWFTGPGGARLDGVMHCLHDSYSFYSAIHVFRKRPKLIVEAYMPWIKRVLHCTTLCIVRFIDGLICWRCRFLDFNIFNTRLHSSRMRTAHSLTISPSMLCLGGGGVWSLGRGSYALGGAWSRGWWYPSMHWGRPPLWTEFLSHASENITLPQTSFAGGKNKREHFHSGNVPIEIKY